MLQYFGLCRSVWVLILTVVGPVEENVFQLDLMVKYFADNALYPLFHFESRQFHLRLHFFQILLALASQLQIARFFQHVVDGGAEVKGHTISHSLKIFLGSFVVRLKVLQDARCASVISRFPNSLRLVMCHLS